MNQAIYSPALTANQKSVYSTPITSVYQHIPANKTSVNADLREFSTFSTNQPELKGNNEPKTLNSLVSYCLSNQSRILVTLADIGQFLKLLTESALGSNFDSPSKLTSINTKTLNSQYSRQVQSANAKSKDKSIIEKCLQPIIANIENIQTEVANKLQEFDASNQTDHSSHINFTSKADSPMTSFPNHYLRLPGSKANDVSPKIATSKLDQPTTLNTVGKLVRSPSADQKPQKANETDCSNYDILNTEYSQSNIAALHNIPSSNPEQLSPTKNKNFDRLSQNTEGLMKSQNDALNSKKSEQQKNPNPVWTLAATGTNSTITGKSNPKQKMVPAIRLNFLTNPKPLSESKKDQNTQSCTKLRGEEQSLQTQEKGYLFNNTGSLRTVEDRDSRGAITARFGLSSDRNESSQVKFISAKNTAREQYNTPRDSARLLLNSLPKKELNDESVDNGERTLITEQVDAYSIPFIDEKIPFNPASFKNSARDSVLTRSDSPFEQFAANIAQKERAIIKTLMKDQYGEELVSSYHKADHGSAYQKKYLINAKWWREWRDFVHFESNDTSNKEKGSLYPIKSYPRPGPINNKELLKQDVMEGSEPVLKENLLEHHDFEAVNKKIYDVLSKWYGSDFEICRVLRPDPYHGGKPFLDLYPRKKVVKRTSTKSMDFKNAMNDPKANDNVIKINLQ